MNSIRSKAAKQERPQELRTAAWPRLRDAGLCAKEPRPRRRPPAAAARGAAGAGGGEAGGVCGGAGSSQAPGIDQREVGGRRPTCATRWRGGALSASMGCPSRRRTCRRSPGTSPRTRRRGRASTGSTRWAGLGLIRSRHVHARYAFAALMSATRIVERIRIKFRFSFANTLGSVEHARTQAPSRDTQLHEHQLIGKAPKPATPRAETLGHARSERE